MAIIYAVSVLYKIMHNASASKKIKCLEMYQIEFQLELTGAVGTKLVVTFEKWTLVAIFSDRGVVLVPLLLTLKIFHTLL